MLKNTRNRIIRTLLLILGGVRFVYSSACCCSVGRTVFLKISKDENSLKYCIPLLEEQGPEGVLALSGLQVADILSGEDGLILFEENQSIYYSAAEKQQMSVYENVNKSVVHITTVGEAAVSAFMDILPAQGTGSGIILSKDGYILTNAHVVEKSASIQVGLYNNQSYAATLVGIDSEDDLAVIKLVSAKDVLLYPATLGTSEDLQIGQRVIAIGNPFGYDRTMSVGVVSGLNRPVRTSEGKVIMNAIQTDAAIHPGNSGGPLLNTQGEVVGINSAIFTTSGSSQGLNFAIPVDTAIAVIPDLIKQGKISRGWLDLAAVQLTPQLVSYAKLSVEKGVLVSEVTSGGFAEKAGIKGGSRKVQYGSSVINLGGDVITAINGETIRDLNDLYLALLPMRSGEKVSVTVNRDGNVKKMEVGLIERTAQHVSALVR